MRQIRYYDDIWMITTKESPLETPLMFLGLFHLFIAEFSTNLNFISILFVASTLSSFCKLWTYLTSFWRLRFNVSFREPWTFVASFWITIINLFDQGVNIHNVKFFWYLRINILTETISSVHLCVLIYYTFWYNNPAGTLMAIVSHTNTRPGSLSSLCSM